MNEWISRTERQPPNHEDVLLTDGIDIEIGCWDVCGFVGSNMDDKVTHWMHLPIPPFTTAENYSILLRQLNSIAISLPRKYSESLLYITDKLYKFRDKL